jgi:predicted anti-sigma-YlaC factor YlaD
MSQHVPEDLLLAFVEGEVGETLAVHIAEHLDTCSQCATRAATLEPLASAFAAVDDPVPPPDLVPAILAAAAVPARALARVEVAMAGLLLVAAVLVAVVFGDPLALVVRLGVLTDVVATIATKASAGLWSSTLALAFSTVAALSAVFATFRVALPQWRLS